MSSGHLIEKSLSKNGTRATVIILMLMVSGTTLAMMPVGALQSTASESDSSDGQTPAQQTVSYNGEQLETVMEGDGNRGIMNPLHPLTGLDLAVMHPALIDPGWNDYGAMYGKIADMEAYYLLEETYGLSAELPRSGDHDNDGILDLEDLDDDNDGIYDLIERFDGCFGTDPYDHDNDGILDHIDHDDDNDGILESPIDFNRSGLDPVNVTRHRYILEDFIHPWTGQPVGQNYLADQNPWDHDNDGVPDEDSDGSGAGSYDEDDDNDGRIDQFQWPCDYDSDGVADYFDEDDDDDGVADVLDRHPYNASETSLMSSFSSYNSHRLWERSDYQTLDAQVDFVAWEAAIHPTSPAFTEIRDGDLDGDGIPNFLDPDLDNDETPNSVDTDDDNDGLLDMWDPDDDNDGIADVCIRIDTNGDGNIDYPGVTGSLQTPGTDCEIDYDSDLDNDMYRAFDQNYNSIWDWFDPSMGGTIRTQTDSVTNKDPGLGSADQPYDLDNDALLNENDSYILTPLATVQGWNCETNGITAQGGINTNQQYNPALPSDPRCITERASYTQNNDWDGDGINNWIDVDDDNDGIPDIIDIDYDCDFDNDNDLNLLNGSRYRDDGRNIEDIDIDGDGLTNDIDFDDDNDGLSDIFDPDDGNCGTVDYDTNDIFYQPYYPLKDGDKLDGALDGGQYTSNATDHWNMAFRLNPFETVDLNYNGYDPINRKGGTVSEFYWYFFTRWASTNGENAVDTDADGDSLVNGLDTDQDSDGLPDWWDQDEGNDGLLDIYDFKMGGSTDNRQTCGWTVEQGFVCGWEYAIFYRMPLQGSNQFSLPYSTRPDPTITDYTWEFNGNEINSSGYNTDGQGTGFGGMENNRDMWNAWIGLQVNTLNWAVDFNGNEFPDELVDALKDDVDPDNDCPAPLGAPYPDPTCMRNDTADVDDDFDSVYDAYDVDDDNDGIWDYFEVDSDNDWDDDANVEMTSFFTGLNCEDNDDDGTDTDPNGDGFYDAVWDRGMLVQGYMRYGNYIIEHYYDVDNDNDGIPDPEDPDDDNDGILDSAQEGICFWGEENHPWDHDNDGNYDWDPNGDWDGDGILNNDENIVGVNLHISRWDHDNDGDRDDLDEDDDEDGMKDKDEVLLWPQRFFTNSTNPWDHDDYGNGEGIWNPNDPLTGPDGQDIDDDSDYEGTRGDWTLDTEQWETVSEGGAYYPTNCTGALSSSDWDRDNDCVLDADDKWPTRIYLDNFSRPMWIDTKVPAVFSGHVDWMLDGYNWTPAPEIPIQIIIRWKDNQTVAIESADILTDQNGDFTVGQFLRPEDLLPAANGTYEVWAEVTELFFHDYSKTPNYETGVMANLTADIALWEYFRSEEQPLWFDFKAHYEADWTRNIYDNRLVHAPFTFTLKGPSTAPLDALSSEYPFKDGKNITNGGAGFRTDRSGWASVTYDQANDTWDQVRWNVNLNNGRGGYEQIFFNPVTGDHDSQGAYDYTNTSLIKGEYAVEGFLQPELSSTGIYPHTVGDETTTFMIRAVHRMFLDAKMHVPSTNPIQYFDSNIFNGASFGAWRTVLYTPALPEGVTCEEAGVGLSYLLCWDGDPATLPGAADQNVTSPTEQAMKFVSVNATHWTIDMLSSGSLDVPPCGPVDITLSSSLIRCEVVPIMSIREEFEITGSAANRSHVGWACPPPTTASDCYRDGKTDPINLMMDVNGDGGFSGSFSGKAEIAKTEYPRLVDSSGDGQLDGNDDDAIYDFDFYWNPNYGAGTYMISTNFAQSGYYFTGEVENVAFSTGTYANITLTGETQFTITSSPRIYRNTQTIIDARLIDNAGLPVSSVGVDWAWLGSGGDVTTGTAFTDTGGLFQIELDIEDDHELGEFDLMLSYAGSKLLKGTTSELQVWVVSRTHLLELPTVSCAPRCMAGETWEVAVRVIDDNRTPFTDEGGTPIDGRGTVQVIFEGLDKQDRVHRRVVGEIVPSSGQARKEFLLNPADIRLMKDSYLPDGYGPVTVHLRYVEDLPHEGCLENRTQLEDSGLLNLQGAWDPCTSIPLSNDFRITMPYYNDGGGFMLVSRPLLSLDNQETDIYTSDAEGNAKPMILQGTLRDELGEPLDDRRVRVSWSMENDFGTPGKCRSGPNNFAVTDMNGNWTIQCDISNAKAGNIDVKVEFNNTDQIYADVLRYESVSTTRPFRLVSNSTFEFDTIGDGSTGAERALVEDILKNNLDRGGIAANSARDFIPVVYYDEPFHVSGWLNQTNGRPLAGKCLSVWIDDKATPEETDFTDDETGRLEYASYDEEPLVRFKPPYNPAVSSEGLHTLTVKYLPDRVHGDCEIDRFKTTLGTEVSTPIFVRVKVKLLMESVQWNDDMLIGQTVEGAVRLQQIDGNPVAQQQVSFQVMYLDPQTDEWTTYTWIDLNFTNAEGVVPFEWTVPLDNPCPECQWTIAAHANTSYAYKDTSNPRLTNHSFRVTASLAVMSDKAGYFTPQTQFLLITSILVLAIIGAVAYRRYLERRRVEVLRGILTDTMLQLRAANEYIQVIFNCYNELVRFFRKHGFLKKVYETTREFEDAVRRAFYMVPAAELDRFLAIFEEARYSNHNIGAEQRDGAIQTLQVITMSIDSAIGADGMISRTSEFDSALHGKQTKAGEFVNAEGKVTHAGEEGTDSGSSFKI